MEFLTLSNLITYHNCLIHYIDKRIELAYEGKTNCPNCGAIITDKICKYCGTNFVKWYEIGED